MSGLGNVPSEFLPAPPPTRAETAQPVIVPGPPYAVEQFAFAASDPSRPTPARGDEPAARRAPSPDGRPLSRVTRGRALPVGGVCARLRDECDGVRPAARRHRRGGIRGGRAGVPAYEHRNRLPVGGRDVVAQVGDLRFVIGVVQDLARAPDSPLTGRVLEGPVGVVGHSDGGITAAAAAFASDVRDERIGGAVVLSGASGNFGGSWFTSGSSELLAIHGDTDNVNPFGSSASLYSQNRSGAPRYLVSVTDAGHTDAFIEHTEHVPAVVVLIADFLRGVVARGRRCRSQIAYDGSVPGVLELLEADDR